MTAIPSRNKCAVIPYSMANTENIKKDDAAAI
jgi:hypothetical protein